MPWARSWDVQFDHLVGEGHVLGLEQSFRRVAAGAIRHAIGRAEGLRRQQRGAVDADARTTGLVDQAGSGADEHGDGGDRADDDRSRRGRDRQPGERADGRGDVSTSSNGSRSPSAMRSKRIVLARYGPPAWRGAAVITMLLTRMRDRRKERLLCTVSSLSRTAIWRGGAAPRGTDRGGASVMDAVFRGRLTK
jgi:hypothetical protein